MIRKRRNGFLNRSQNVLYKYFFYPWFLGWGAPESGFLFFCATAWGRLEQRRPPSYSPEESSRMSCARSQSKTFPPRSSLSSDKKDPGALKPQGPGSLANLMSCRVPLLLLAM